MSKLREDTTIAALLGSWLLDWHSGLIARCRMAWNKPLRDLNNEDLVTLLRLRIAAEHILSIARKRVEDGTEMYKGELEAAIEYVAGHRKEK
jgi:hypothetical protein